MRLVLDREVHIFLKLTNSERCKSRSAFISSVGAMSVLIQIAIARYLQYESKRSRTFSFVATPSSSAFFTSVLISQCLNERYVWRASIIHSSRSIGSWRINGAEISVFDVSIRNCLSSIDNKGTRKEVIGVTLPHIHHIVKSNPQSWK